MRKKGNKGNEKFKTRGSKNKEKEKEDLSSLEFNDIMTQFHPQLQKF